MVARGVIARTIERLWDSVKRIDRAVHLLEPGDRWPEHQPSERTRKGRLRVADPDDPSCPCNSPASTGLGRNKVNFISLTPGTAFNLRSATGVVRERALLFHLLKDVAEPRRGLYNLLRVNVGIENWEWAVEGIPFDEVDLDLADGFRTACVELGMLDELNELCRRFHWRRNQYPDDMIWCRNAMLGRFAKPASRTSASMRSNRTCSSSMSFNALRNFCMANTMPRCWREELFDYTDRSWERRAYPASLRDALQDADPFERRRGGGRSLPRANRNVFLPVRAPAGTRDSRGIRAGNGSISSLDAVVAGGDEGSTGVSIVDRAANEGGGCTHRARLEHRRSRCNGGRPLSDRSAWSRKTCVLPLPSRRSPASQEHPKSSSTGSRRPTS